uniref:Integrase catalytic domain-containing protein n=1 Tax=Chenopodium quinoa TaxID=63459 RepID=A0A803L706_CHEQI
MEDQIKNLEKRIDDQISRFDQKIDEMLKMMQAMQAEKVSTPSSSEPSSPTYSNGNLSRSNSTRTLGMNPKLELPKFNGVNPRIWVKKCCKYFNLCKIADDQKVDLASLNMTDKAEHWVMNYLSIRRSVVVDWNDFVVDLYARFREKIAKGLCYYCDQPYTRENQCQFKKPQLFTVEIPGSIDSESDEDLGSFPNSIDEPQISMHALAGNQSFQTMRVIGRIQGKDLHILIDSGSTHNFVDASVASKLGCSLEQIPFQAISVADGNHIPCQQACKGFAWSMHGHNFEADVLVIPLGSCYMVLGIQWLRMLGSIHWDFQKLRMEFTFQGKQIVLKGIPPKNLSVVEGDPRASIMDSSIQLCLLHVQDSNCFVGQMEQDTNTVLSNSEFLAIKQQYAKVFEEPSALTPVRGVFDHSIPLIPGSTPLQNQVGITDFKWEGNLLKRKGKIVVGPDLQLRNKILAWHHDSPDSGHGGRELTLKRAAKYDTAAYPGHLQPLPVPEEVWIDISMDFFTGIPKSAGKDCYLDSVFKLHGWPRSIVSDRDSIFVSQFWRGLFSLYGTDLKLSTTYHPQTDGQTEVVNRCLEAYLRCMTGDEPQEWHKWLPLAEWWYNTHFHSALQLTPYEVVYNQPPPLHLPYLAGEVKNDELGRSQIVGSEDIRPAAILDRKIVRFQNRA